MTQGLSVEMEIADLTTLDRKFQDMANNPERRLMLKHFRAAGTVLAKAYRNAAPIGPMSGKIKKTNRKNTTGILLDRKGVSVKQSARSKVKSKSKRYVAVKAGFNVGAKSASRRAPHAHLVVLGTKERQHKSGKSTGRVSATANILRRTINANLSSAVPQTLMKIETRMFEEIEREWLV